MFLTISCSERGYNFRDPERLPVRIVERIMNDEKWENEFLKKLFKKYEISRIDDAIVLKNNSKNDKEPNVIIQIKTSNVKNLMHAQYDIFNKIDDADHQYSLEDALNKYKQFTSINFHYFPNIDYADIIADIVDLIGPPQTSTNNEDTWYINDYRIMIDKQWGTIDIQMKYDVQY